MMPQKKNADTLELIRGKSGLGHRQPDRHAHAAQGPAAGVQPRLAGRQTVRLRNRRRDEAVAGSGVRALSPRRNSIAGASGKTSTRASWTQPQLAEYLVTKGVPFRKAHGIVGGLVARSEKLARRWLTCRWRRCARRAAGIGPDVAEHLGAANVVNRYAPPGAGGQKQVKEQLKFWKKQL